MAQENPAGSLKYRARQIAKTFAVRGGGLSLFHRLRHREMLTVLMFHRVLPADLMARQCVDEEYTISTSLFESLLDFASTHYNIVSLSDVLKSRTRQAPLPSYPLLVTFDDGWNDNASHGAPLLAAAGAPWTLFAATDAVSSGAAWWQETLLAALRSGRAAYDDVMAAGLAAAGRGADTLPDEPTLAILLLYGALPPGQRDALIARQCGAAVPDAAAPHMADWSTLRALRDSGVAIGGHGASHLPLTLIADPVADLTEAKNIMQRQLGDAACTALSFPHGRYDRMIADAARGLGIKLLFTSDPVLNKCPGGWLESDLVGRISISTASVADRGGALDAERVMPWLMLRASRDQIESSCREKASHA